MSVDLQVASQAENVPNEAQIELWVAGATAAADKSEKNGYELAVRVVDDVEGQALNSKYRHKDRPTNVLSFPFETMAGLPVGEPRALGDLVICAPVVEREAVQQGKSSQDHWAHMVVHGTLHLLGYDHETDEEAGAMEAVETKILQSFGIDNPYTER